MGYRVHTCDLHTPTAQGGLQHLVLLATIFLKPNHPVMVRHMAKVGQDKENVDPPKSQPPAALTRVAAVTRKAFAQGVAGRFVSPSSHRDGMAMFLTPHGCGLKCVEKLQTSTIGTLGGFTKSADDVKVVIGQVEDVLTKAIEKGRAGLRTTPDRVAGGGAVENRHRRRCRSAVRGVCRGGNHGLQQR